MPFEIPASWEWVRLGDISNYGQTNHTDVDSISSADWVLELEDIERDTAHILQVLQRKDRQISGVRNYFKKGQILYSKLRTYLNKVLVAPQNGFCTTEIIPFSCYGTIEHRFIANVLRSQYFVDYTTLCCYGCKMPRFSTEDAQKGLIPLPPLPEQKRIADSIVQWFALIDEIEANKKDLQEYIKQTKSKVLDLAIHGKLVPQDPNDEPAIELLRRINPHFIPCDTSHYENLPEGWCVCLLKDVAKTISSREFQVLQSEILENGKYPVISQSANYIEGYNNDEKKLLHHSSPIVIFGDHTRIVKYVEFDFIVGADGVKILLPSIDAKYFYYLVIFAAENIDNRGYGRHFSYLSKFPMLVPPFEEQKRIVKKIDEVFSQLDQITAEL